MRNYFTNATYLRTGAVFSRRRLSGSLRVNVLDQLSESVYTAFVLVQHHKKTQNLICWRQLVSQELVLLFKLCVSDGLLCVTVLFFLWASVNVYHTEAFTPVPVFWHRWMINEQQRQKRVRLASFNSLYFTQLYLELLVSFKSFIKLSLLSCFGVPSCRKLELGFHFEISVSVTSVSISRQRQWKGENLFMMLTRSQEREQKHSVSLDR